MTAPPGALARVLVVAGSDSGGGAGIQADIKSITAMGGYAATAVTAVTAQDTTGVHAIHAVPLTIVIRQVEAVLDDIGADAIKTGMLGQAGLIAAIADLFLGSAASRVPIVVDPVMVAKGGARLLPADAVEALRTRLVPLASVLTPNLPEAEALVGFPVRDIAAMREAARALLALGPRAVLLKGGHLAGDDVVDVLVTADGRTTEFRDGRIPSRQTHGTGCTLASAIATGLAQGLSVEDAVRRARLYVRAAILHAPGFGRGQGPLNHLVSDPWHLVTGGWHPVSDPGHPVPDRRAPVAADRDGPVEREG